MITLPPIGRHAQHLLKSAPGWVWRIATTWLRWFWSLGVAAKIVATGVEGVLLWAAAQHVPFTPATRSTVVQFGSLALCFLLIAGVLVGRPGGRR